MYSATVSGFDFFMRSVYGEDRVSKTVVAAHVGSEISVALHLEAIDRRARALGLFSLIQLEFASMRVTSISNDTTFSSIRRTSPSGNSLDDQACGSSASTTTSSRSMFVGSRRANACARPVAVDADVVPRRRCRPIFVPRRRDISVRTREDHETFGLREC